MAEKNPFSVTAWLYDLGARIQFRPSCSFGASTAPETKPLSAIGARILPYKKRVKSALSKMAEQSAILECLRRALAHFFALRVRSFGVFFFSCGFFQILQFFLGAFLPGFSVGEENLVFGVAQIFLTLLCSFARGSVADALRHSFLFRSILHPFFGLQEWQIPSGKNRDNLLVMFLSGAIVGVLTLLISPVQIAIGVLLFVLICYLFFAPEAGLILCLTGTVFLPVETVSGFVLITLVSFLFKCSVGKRSLVFSPMDPVVFFFLLPFLSESGAISFFSLFFLYYLTSCLVRSVSVLGRLLTSFCAVCVMGSLLLVLRQVVLFFLPEALVRIKALESVFFVTPSESYGLVFAMAIPLVLGLMRSGSTRGKKVVRFASFLLLLVSLLLVRSSVVWVAAIVGVMVYFLFSYRSSLILMCLLGLGTITLLNVLPTNLLRAVLNIFGMNESSFHVAAQSNYSFLHFLYEKGRLIWVLLFFFVLLLFVWETVRFCVRTTKREVHLRVLGVLCSVAVFFATSVQTVSLDSRSLILFVILLALPRAAFRVAEREEIRLPY